MSTPALAESDPEILRCFPVMAELRPHLVEGEFVQRFEAHRFHLRRRMDITSHHFALNLT